MADTPTREELDELVKHVRWLATLPEIAHYKDKHQRIIDILSTLPPAAAGGGWRPIETAPADTDLLLGWWMEGAWLTTPHWEQEVQEARNTKGGWWHGQATHWQPLPSPPHPDTEDGR